jgi:hypothetical protein
MAPERLRLNKRATAGVVLGTFWKGKAQPSVIRREHLTLAMSIYTYASAI